MEQEKEKLERFISAVEATTNQQVRAIENDAENECANILAEAQKNAEEAKQRKLSDTKKMLSGKYVRMISKAELDMKKAAKSVGEKSVAMLHVKDINAVTGYIRGGCTAIGMKKQYVTRIDESAQALEKMIVSGGKLGMQLELAPQDLAKAANAEFADITA